MRINRDSIGLFNNLTAEHDDDIMADMFHDCKIMRNKQVRKAELILEILEQVNDLSLDTDVQGAYDFVAHYKFGFDCQCASNANALTLAAAEFVGKPVTVFRR